MQQVDDPPSLPVGTEVSAKYKGAFCEAKVSKVVRNIKVKVAYKQGLGSGIVSDDAIKAAPGQLRVGAIVEVRHPDRKENVEATITKIQDCSQYTVVFDDGDITTLRRTALCLKSGRHFNESETLDQLPLTHPEHFGNPVVGGRRGRRRGQLNDGSSDDDDESDAKEVVNEKEENIGKVVCVETESKKKDKEKWFPALVVAPTAQVSKQATVRIRVKDEYLVRSFKDGRYYTVPKKEANEFTREMATKQDGPAILAAIDFLDGSVLPAHWDRDSLFGLSNLTSDDEGEIDSDSSDDEPHEEKDLFVAQLYKYMDDRGTPLNKVPSIQSRDVDLYRLFRAVQKRGGYNRVTAKNQWKLIAMRLGFTPCTISVMNLVKQAYKKFLQPYGDFHRKLGCSMLMPSRNSNRSKGRSLVRANSVASPKPADTTKMETISKLAVANQTVAAMASSSSSNNSSGNNASTSTATATTTSTAASSSSSANATVATPIRAASTASQSAAEESENTSESSVVVEPVKKQRKASAASSGKVKSLVEKYEEKASEKSNATAATAAATAAAATTTTAATGVAVAVATAANVSSNVATASSAAAVAATAAAAPPAATAASVSTKDAEADMPLSKIKAAAATRNSIDKEPNAGGSNASSKATSEPLRSRDASPTTAASTAAATTTTTSSSTATTTAAATTTTSSAAAATAVAAAAVSVGGGGGAGGTTTTKKEKHQQRKQVDKSDEKRGKRKKDEITVEKIDTGDFIVGIGDKLKVNYHEKKSPSSHGSTYEAKVIEISVQRGVPMYLVHYTGWNNRYDEWVPRERIAENLTKGSKQKTRTISTSSANSGGAPAHAASSGCSNNNNSSSGGNNSTAPGGSNSSLPLKDGPGKAATTAAAGGGGGGGGGGEQQHQQPPPGSGASVLQGVTKTPTSTPTTATLASGKRGRGRSDSMPPRSTTPSSVASNSSRTKSPAASQSQLKQKRPTRTLPSHSSNSNNNQQRRISASASVSANVSDASMGSDSDTDSDEPVRRPKRLNAKEQQQQQQQQQGNFGKTAKATSVTAAATSATTATGSGKKAASVRLARASGSEDSDDDEDEETAPSQSQPPNKQSAQATQQQQSQPVQRQRAGNRALSSGSAAPSGGAPAAAGGGASGAASKGRDYDLSEIRSELKGFQPQLLDRKDAAVIKSEPSETQAKQEPKTGGSSTEQSSETDSYIDEDSQSSEKLEYRSKQAISEKAKLNIEKIKTGSVAGSAATGSVDLPGEASIKKEVELQIKHETAAGEDRKPFKTEPKEEQLKPFHSSLDIKPTTTATTSLIAPARFGNSNVAASGGKCTSVIVEKPLTLLKKTEAAAGGGGTSTAGGAAAATTILMPAKKLELLKKQQQQQQHHHQQAATSEAGKKFVEPVVHKETATLKVELPAACSPSNSSSSSSSFCSSSNNSAITTVSMSSSSATRSLPDMSKLEISSGATGAGTGTVAGGGGGATGTAKESKYSSSSGSSISNIASGIKLLSSDVYEFKDTEPFEFEKRISPMASMSCGGASVIATATPATGSGSNTINSSSSNTTVGSNVGQVVARKQALKASAIEKHQLPHEQQRGYATTAAAAATVAAATAATTVATSALGTATTAATQSKAKKRGSPLKENTDKSKLPKLEQQQHVAAATLPQSSPAASPNSVKAMPGTAKTNVTAATAVATATVATVGGAAGITQLQPGHATPFDVLRRSPSFNLNITALNEELAQTVQETTRALTDALQPPTTPSTPATPATPPAITSAAAATIVAGATPPIAVPVSPKLSTPPQAMAVAKTTQQQQQQQHIVGSPFMETRNVFELSTSNEGSGYSSGESNKDNKLEKLENVKILLAGAAGPFDLDAVKYEQKPSSIADKVLKAISLKKEEVEQSKTKSQLDNNQDKEDQSPSSNIKSEPGSSLNLKLDTLKLLSEPLKIQTGGAAALPVLSDLYRRTSCSNSPETKSILDASLPAKNSELSETIQKLECAIQQRKTPVAGQSLASSTAGTPPVTATAPTTFSDESMDSTDSEQRLVIEDVMAEEPSMLSELKSPMSEASGSLSGSAPVKLELTAVGSKQLTGVAAPIALKPMARLPGAVTAATVSGIAASSPVMPTCVPIVLPEIPVSVVVALRPSSSGASSLSPASPKPEPKVQLQLPLPLPMSDESGMFLLYRPQSPALSDAVVATSSPLPRPFVLQPAKETPLNVSPAASSPLISDATHNEAAINLLCEETIPGSPAPNYSSKDEPSGVVTSTATPATVAPVIAATSNALSIVGITPLPPDTPPPRAVPAALINQPATATVAGANTAAPTAVATSAAAAAAAAAAASVSPNSSPESPASQDDSSEENGSSSLLSVVKKYVELESTSLGGRRKRSRTKASDVNVQSSTLMTPAAAAAELHALGKRRRQQLNSMRKTTTTTVGSDTDDNSDNIVTTQRQSTRQQLLPQAQQLQQQLQQQQQQQQQQQHQQLQQQQQQLQQQQQTTVNASGVRPCPYNFLVELDPSLSAEQCILILRKQIQDLRKAYNTIKGDLAVIDRRRKKLRRREREKKQQQQLQSGQPGKVCT